MSVQFGSAAASAIRSKRLYGEMGVSIDGDSPRIFAAALRFGIGAGLVSADEVQALRAEKLSGAALARGAQMVMKRLQDRVTGALARAGYKPDSYPTPGAVQFTYRPHWDAPALAIYQDVYEVMDFEGIWSLCEADRRLVLTALGALNFCSEQSFCASPTDNPYTETSVDEILYELPVEKLARDKAEMDKALAAVEPEYGEHGQDMIRAVVFEHLHAKELALMRRGNSARHGRKLVGEMLAHSRAHPALRAWARKVRDMGEALGPDDGVPKTVHPWLDQQEEEGMVPRGYLNVVNVGSEDCAELYDTVLNDVMQNEQGLDLLTLEPRAAPWVVSMLVRVNLSHALLREGLDLVVRLSAEAQKKKGHKKPKGGRA